MSKTQSQQLFMTRDLKSSIEISGNLYQRLGDCEFRAIRTHGRNVSFQIVVNKLVVCNINVPATQRQRAAAAWFAANTVAGANLNDAAA